MLARNVRPVEFGNRLNPVHGCVFVASSEAGDLKRYPLLNRPNAQVGDDEAQFAQTASLPPCMHSLHSFGGRGHRRSLLGCWVGLCNA